MADSASKPIAVSDSDIRRILDEEIASGVTFDNDGDKDRRSVALDYYDGVMRDLPAEQGRSSVVSRDTADVIDTMMPGLMRIFAGAGTLGVYEPAKEGDEEGARQATEYFDYVLANDCDGFRLISTWLKDGLQVRNGVIKIWWDPSVDYEVEDQRNLTADEATVLFRDEGIAPADLLGVRPHIQKVPDPVGGPPVEVELFDLRYRRVSSEDGRLRIENVPPEDFGISAKATSIETAACVWHRARMTRSDLIKQGYDRASIDELPVFDANPTDEADRDRDEASGRTASRGDGAMAEIEVVEAYLYADCDGDGIAESRKVVAAGAKGGRKILENVEWPDDRPFVDWTPQPVPHAWMGRSPADDVMPLQRVKTVLTRGLLDNMYAQNRPGRLANLNMLEDPDDLLVSAFGQVIRVKGNNSVLGAVSDLVVPNILPTALSALQYIDALIQRRTGVSQATASLDQTALDPQTATAEQLEHDAAYARVELIARNFAELGIKRLYRKALRIMVRNQDRPRTIRLRDKWTPFDPRAWNASMDVSVNVGLGTGSRERDLAMLGAVYARQIEIYEKLGPGNPIVTQSMIVGTLHKMVEASGIRNPDAYFRDLSDQDFAQWQASKPPAPPDPKIAAIEARAKADAEKNQAQIALGQSRQQADLEMDKQASLAKLEMQRQELEAKIALKREELAQEAELRRIEMDNEAALRAAQMMNGATGISTNLPRQ